MMSAESRHIEAVLPGLRLLALARAACENGATQAELLRDLKAFVLHKLALPELREALRGVVAGLTVNDLARTSRERTELTAAGRELLAKELGGQPLPSEWAEMRDVRLVARALGLQSQPLSRIRRLTKPDGLRAAVLQSAFNLKIKGAPSPSKLRHALAVVALERAFGNTLKGTLGSRTGLAPKAGRLLAAQLSIRPRDFGTDSRLVAALAAEQAGSFQTGADAVRHALLRTLVEPLDKTEKPPFATKVGIASKRQSPRGSRPIEPAAPARPDLPRFADVVRTAANARAEGWSGNRKAYISHVWSVVQAQHPEWGLTDIEFKAMLAEAHRTGHVVLANADLKDKNSMKDIQDSAVAYKNTVWHFVRVET